MRHKQAFLHHYLRHKDFSGKFYLLFTDYENSRYACFLSSCFSTFFSGYSNPHSAQGCTSGSPVTDPHRRLSRQSNRRLQKYCDLAATGGQASPQVRCRLSAIIIKNVSSIAGIRSEANRMFAAVSAGGGCRLV